LEKIAKKLLAKNYTFKNEEKWRLIIEPHLPLKARKQLEEKCQKKPK